MRFLILHPSIIWLNDSFLECSEWSGAFDWVFYDDMTSACCDQTDLSLKIEQNFLIDNVNHTAFTLELVDMDQHKTKAETLFTKTVN